MHKYLFFIFFTLMVWAGCTKAVAPQTLSFTDTGCSRSPASRAESDETGISLLVLRYEDGNLRVTKTNTILCCSIKYGGLVSDVTVQGNEIHYNVYEKDGPNVNCFCQVDEISSLISGLSEGQEYTFSYHYGSNAIPPTSVNFVFQEGLVLIREE